MIGLKTATILYYLGVFGFLAVFCIIAVYFQAKGNSDAVYAMVVAVWIMMAIFHLDKLRERSESQP